MSRQPLTPDGLAATPNTEARAKCVWVVSDNPQLFDECARAVAEVEGWVATGPHPLSAVLEQPAASGIAVIDGQLGDGAAYEASRRLALAGAPRSVLVLSGPNEVVEPIARFCGARGVLQVGFEAAELAELIAEEERFAAPRGPETEQAPQLPRALLEDLVREQPSGSRRMIEALSDPETSLFNFDFLSFKLDDEFKRARRFGQPLSCVILGFDGEANEETLGRLAGIFLQAARDTDVLGRFDRSSFLFLLPNTPGRGAETMASRIREAAESAELRDVIGESLDLSVGIATYPHPDIRRSRDLFQLARETFHEAQRAGVGVTQAI
ncbi:MAG: GGDEF domain-containing protein [Planctomycetota bacterium]